MASGTTVNVLGSGVSATLSATTTATFVGGLGNDIITTGVNAQTGSVNAGSGTDILVLAATAHISDTAEGAIYKGFETLRAENNTSLDMDLVTRENMRNRLTKYGISSDRVSLLGPVSRAEYLAAHAEVDILLDTLHHRHPQFPSGDIWSCLRQR